ncbi:ribbon-helix-helix domain-containing protein [Sphingomonas sp. NPDC079357]|uniref:ribbon-helix-helix domain-containing protein n=1 Tax=Sphingomonas sp. NPDC079357 TaxID=3364518 RepID=UPI00385111E8
MSRKPSFANLRGTATPPPAAAPAPRVKTAPAPAPAAVSAPSPEPVPVSTRPVSREGRKQIAGFFSPDMSLAMHMLARRQGRSLQALMAEAFNDVLRKHGESPIGD